MTSAPEPRWLAASDVARLTGFSRRYATELMKREMPVFGVGEKSLRVKVSDFEAWARAKEANRLRFVRQRRKGGKREPQGTAAARSA